MAGTTYYSDPVEVTHYKSLAIRIGWIAEAPTGSLVSGQLQVSEDLQTWTDLGAVMDPALGGVLAATATNPGRYVRFAVTVSAAGNCLVTVWAQAITRMK